MSTRPVATRRYATTQACCHSVGASVARVIGEWNNSENKELTERKPSGQPKKEANSNVAEVIRDIVISVTPLTLLFLHLFCERSLKKKVISR